jgi:hypothetical protein
LVCEDSNVDVKGAALLYTMAGLMVTFAGFSAILLSVRQAAGAQLSVLDRFLARTVLTFLFTLTAGALLPPLLSLYDISESFMWKIAAVLFGLPMLFLQMTYPGRRRKAVGAMPPPIILAVFVIFASAVIAAMMIYVCAGFYYAAAAYITAVLANFLTTAFAFITAVDVILRDPVDRPR